MSWISTIVTAIFTAAVGCIASGFVANQAVRWYKISGFEGGSGYFVVMIALGGLLGGLVIGAIASRIVAAGANPSFVKGLGLALAVTLVIVTAVAVPSRLLADVAPTVEGEELMLMVEARWPVTQTESPANSPGISYLELGSVTSSRVQRISKRGALWKEDARLVDGHWTVTGAVPVFTERGKRVIDVALNDSTHSAFQLQLPARPSKKDFEWTEWFPKDGKGGAVKLDRVNYRYHVQKISAPVRVEKFGNFEIGMVPQYFQQQSAPGTTTYEAWGNFEITYHGKPAKMPDGSASPLTFNSGMVALLPSANTALLVSLSTQDSEYGCSLLVDDSGTLRFSPVAPCSGALGADEITSDNERFAQVKTASVARGHVDKLTYAHAKFLLFYQTVLNIGKLEVHKFNAKVDPSRLAFVPSVPPLGMSPDERSFVRYAVTNGVVNNPALIVTDYVGDRNAEIQLDYTRMRFNSTDDLTSAWLLHHFAWERGADGFDALVERKGYTPIPYHGHTSIEGGGQEYYKIDRGGQVVRMALVEMLEKDFDAKRMSGKDDEYSILMMVRGVRVSVASSGEPSDYVMMSLDYGQPPSKLAGELGKAFDAVLATGKYDAAFTQLAKH